jgi:hypothetical protein
MKTMKWRYYKRNGLDYPTYYRYSDDDPMKRIYYFWINKWYYVSQWKPRDMNRTDMYTATEEEVFLEMV